MIVGGLRHRAACPQDVPLHAFVGHLGDPMHRCPTCRAIGTAPEQVRNDYAPEPRPAEQVAPEPLPEPVPMFPRFVCGEHPEKYVDGRGRGCPECARLARRPRRR